MQTTKTLSVAAFVLIITIGLTAGDCIPKLQECDKTFLPSMVDHVVKNKTIEICSDIETYVSCLYKQDCDITSELQTNVIKQLNSIFAQYDLQCSFTVSEILNRYKNGATSNSPLPSALLLVVLVIVSLKFRVF